MCKLRIHELFISNKLPDEFRLSLPPKVSGIVKVFVGIAEKRARQILLGNFVDREIQDSFDFVRNIFGQYITYYMNMSYEEVSVIICSANTKHTKQFVTRCIFSRVINMNDRRYLFPKIIKRELISFIINYSQTMISLTTRNILNLRERSSTSTAGEGRSQ